MQTRQGRSGLPTASNGGEFTWAYLPGSDLKASLQYPNGLTASWTYDANNQFLQVRNATPTNVISQFDYTYDAAGRRVSIAKSGSAFGDLSGSVDTYTYNARSELTSARRTKNGQPIPGFSEDFDYDPIGNRRSSSTYNEKGEAQNSTYQANNLNQYTTRTTPGYAAVRGEADPNATVTVNENPTFRLGSYYFGSDIFDNSTSGGLAILETYATLAQTAANGDETEDLVSVETNQVYIAQSPETFAYDADGNQTLITTKTGLWRVTYNGENRPILWMRDSDNTTLAMSYDHMGRRREKNNQRFFYDGYLQVVNFHSPTQTQSSNYYIWDCTEPIATRPLVWNQGNSSDYYTHDGNKNVSEIVAPNGSFAARYEYAPFGAVTSQTGALAAVNPFRFSGEYAEDDTATVYYNYRHYDSRIGRWLLRDPSEERSCIHLYSYLMNGGLLSSDYLGLACYSTVWGGIVCYPDAPSPVPRLPDISIVLGVSGTRNFPILGGVGISLTTDISWTFGSCCDKKEGRRRSYRKLSGSVSVGPYVGVASIIQPDIKDPEVHVDLDGCPDPGEKIDGFIEIEVSAGGAWGSCTYSFRQNSWSCGTGFSINKITAVKAGGKGGVLYEKVTLF